MWQQCVTQSCRIIQFIYLFIFLANFEMSGTSWTNKEVLHSAPPESLRTVQPRHAAFGTIRDVISLLDNFSEIVLQLIVQSPLFSFFVFVLTDNRKKKIVIQ